MPELRRSSILLDEGRISYIRDGKGTPTLLLHTIGGSAIEYERLIPRLRDALDIVAIDLPGHGCSFALDEYEPIPDISRLLIAIADALKIDQFNVAGNSLSGTNALEVAIEHPTRVRRVVLVSGTGPWADQPGLPQRPNLPTHTSENKEIEWFRSQFFEPARADRPGFFEWWVASRSTADDEMIRAWRRRKMLDRPLADCVAPVLLVTGEHDPQHPKWWADAWTALLPNGRVRQIPQARHFLNLEAPEALADVVTEFLT